MCFVVMAEFPVLDPVDAPVELLIGRNSPLLLTPTELRTPADDSRGPYGVKTVLGWYVFGPVGTAPAQTLGST